MSGMKRSRWLAIAVIAMVLVMGCSLVTFGQAKAPAAGKDTDIVQTLTLQDIIAKGGWLMYVLGLMSVLGLAFVIYFFLVLRRQQVVPETLRREVLSKIKAGQMDDVRTACNYKPCAFSEIALAALDFVQASKTQDPALLKEVLEGEGSRQAAVIQTQTQYLLDIGVIAPMVGLLGTVFGMVHAFGVVALDLAKAKPMLLAAGVAEALVNTAGGLIVGIPAMMFYAYFRGRASKLVSHLEAAALELLTALLRKGNP